jgi:2-dehydro-3-deoxyphosphogluconate aldolase/(4S)-4-hydroxy-2-oxoglutarate aldolase
MLQQSWLSLVQQYRAIAVIRAPDLALGYKMAKAAASGGMRLIEITWNTDQAAELINQLRSEFPWCQVGTGTLLNLDQLQQAIAAGAQFLFTPHIDPVLIQAAIEAGIPIVPGALTTTEIVTAWNAGASCVKVFPIQTVGGVEYIRSLKPVLSNIPLIPTGGVTVANANKFLEAGAIAVGLAGDLFPQPLVAAEDWEAIAQRTSTLMQQLTQRA